ncbi:tetratricopeptide repeat protein [Streptomyces odontomachi]|uniref:tetratricopeptide repeat protein n=1 Tax=Streptomyces odontomachi TaxID=2944940 RepID=UPI00210C4A62|nr:tetratricopeptide repeat protein [Streptomyces sp. ODS25]
MSDIRTRDHGQGVRRSAAPEPSGGPGPAGAGATAGDGSGVAPSGAGLRAGLLVSRARAAARAGDLDQALELLRGPTGAPVADHPDVLDLLARVHGQRGEWDDAAGCWQRVLERHPEDPAATAGLTRIARLRRRGPVGALARHRTGVVLVATACVAAAVGYGVVAVPGDGHRGAPPRAAAPAPDRAAERAADRAREQAVDAAARAVALATFARDLRTPGLRPEVHGDSVEVVFDEGLFSEGAQLTPAGADLLARFGHRLTGRAATITVYGQAATVPGAPTQGGSVTSLWRALVAARELSAASGKPLTAFHTASADQRDAPYGSAARNRTVTVVLTPTGHPSEGGGGPARSTRPTRP